MTKEQEAQAALDDLMQASKNYADALCEHYRSERKAKWRRREYSLRVPSLIFLGLGCFYSVMGHKAAFTASIVIAGLMIFGRVLHDCRKEATIIRNGKINHDRNALPVRHDPSRRTRRLRPSLKPARARPERLQRASGVAVSVMR